VEAATDADGFDILRNGQVTLQPHATAILKLRFTSKRAGIEVHLYITEAIDDSMSSASTDD
jgi:hypothetical protein